MIPNKDSILAAAAKAAKCQGSGKAAKHVSYGMGCCSRCFAVGDLTPAGRMRSHAPVARGRLRHFENLTRGAF